MAGPKIETNPFQIAKNVITEVGKGAGNIGKELTTGINNISRETGKGVSNIVAEGGALADRVLKAPGAGLKNAERNLSGMINDLGYGINTGDYTSFFNRSLALAAPVVGGAPVGLFANPDDVTRLTGTKSGEQKMKDSAEAQAKRDIAEQAKREQDTRLNAIRQYVEGTITTRTKRPGRALTLLGDQASGSTLLTRR